MKFTPALLLLICFITFSCFEQQTSTDVSQEELTPGITTKDKMEWWREAKFGMFIHWGLYAIPAGAYNGKVCNRAIGEWIMDDLEIPIKEYEKFATEIKPLAYDPDYWVQLAKNAGMKYIVITSKHHDGFALWDSEVSEYDVVDASPYGKDLLKPLAEACEREGIKLCFYHSIMDWHHPDAQAIWEPNYQRERSDTLASQKNPRFPNYLEDYLKPQVEELLTNYGDIGVMWFDGEWVPDYTSEQGKDLYNHLMNIKEDLIINNRVDKGRKGYNGFNKEGNFVGDFGTPEQEIPETGIPGLDWESCMTMNDTWGYRKDDHNWKSDTILLKQLIDIVSKGGNFLLNIGPKADGTFPRASIERLENIARWMKLNSESIHGTSSSPFPRPEFGRFTAKGNKVYAHIFDWPKNNELILDDSIALNSAYFLHKGKEAPLTLERRKKGVWAIRLDTTQYRQMIPVVVLEQPDN